MSIARREFSFNRSRKTPVPGADLYLGPFVASQPFSKYSPLVVETLKTCLLH